MKKFAANAIISGNQYEYYESFLSAATTPPASWDAINTLNATINPAASCYDCAFATGAVDMETNVEHWSGTSQLPASYWTHSLITDDVYDVKDYITTSVLASGSTQRLFSMTIGAYRAPTPEFDAVRWTQNRTFLPDIRDYAYITLTRLPYLDRHSPLLKHRRLENVGLFNSGSYAYILRDRTDLNAYEGDIGDGYGWPSGSWIGGWSPFPAKTWAALAASQPTWRVHNTNTMDVTYRYFANTLLGNPDSFFAYPDTTTTDGALYEDYSMAGPSAQLNSRTVHKRPSSILEALFITFERDVIRDGLADEPVAGDIDMSSVLPYLTSYALKAPLQLSFTTRIKYFPKNYITVGAPGVYDYVDIRNDITVPQNNSAIQTATSTVVLTPLDGSLARADVDVVLDTRPAGLYYAKEGILVLALSAIDWNDYKPAWLDASTAWALGKGLTASTIATTGEPVHEASVSEGTLHYSGSAFLGTFSNTGTAWPLNVNIPDAQVTRSTYKDLIMGYKSRLVFAYVKSMVKRRTATYYCDAEKLEYNYSSNPTAFQTDGKMYTIIDTTDSDPAHSRTSNTSRITHSSQTYITKVGLYNRYGDLIAVAALSKPIRKSFSNGVTIAARIRQ